MAIQISDRVQAIKPSPTIAVTTRAQALRAAGEDVIGLGAGEPDFDTADHIKEAAKRALDEGFTKYTAVDGIPSLKQAIIAKFERDNDLGYAPAEIVVSCGAKHSLYNLVHTVINPGDEVLIAAPYWVSYPDMVLLAGGSPVIIETDLESGFKVVPEQLEVGICERTRLFIINSPSNPTGVCYSGDELAALGEVLRRHPQVVVASDDIYEHIRWDETPFVNIVNACPDLYERSVVLNGVSKAYAMTGWRIGYAGGPEAICQGMRKIQSQSTSNPTSIAQVAAEAALNGDQTYIAGMVEVFEQRHDFVLERLNRMRGVECLPAQGAFYAFPDLGEAIAADPDVNDDLELAEKLLETARVALVPGSAFGAPGCARISFATSMENLEQAMDRLDAYFGTD